MDWDHIQWVHSCFWCFDCSRCISSWHMGSAVCPDIGSQRRYGAHPYPYAGSGSGLLSPGAFYRGDGRRCFALSLISCFLGKVSLKKHQNLPYSRADLRNTTGRILCNGILTLGFILMLLFLKFRSFLMIVIVLDQLVICALQVREIHEIRKLPHSA